ncbi:MAG: MerR family transcriptional regulator [Tissierellia bacterium]|nr:MerR family transcriptional regulator [Tissierellia bacterium]
MKKKYRISEISKIYKLSADSLRYYERKGLIKPERELNGYRVYTQNDIWKLNIIKDMRKLDFTIKQIRDYLENRSLNSSVELIEKEIEFIDKEIEPLKRQKKYLSERLESLNNLKEIDEFETVIYKNFDKRKIVLIEGELRTDQEIDLAFRKLESRDDSKLMLFASKDMGVMISKESIYNNSFSDYENAFFLLSDDEEKFDGYLPQGDYAVLFYKGGYDKSERLFKKLISDIESNSYTLIGPILEIYRLDIHSSSNTDEYITEIQARIIKGERS